MSEIPDSAGSGCEEEADDQQAVLTRSLCNRRRARVAAGRLGAVCIPDRTRAPEYSLGSFLALEYELLERAMGIEPTTLCLGIGAASLSPRLPHSQIRNQCLRPAISPSRTRFGHQPEPVPSICSQCTLVSPAVKPSDFNQERKLHVLFGDLFDLVSNNLSTRSRR